jgi:dihydrofolate reductase
MKLIAVQERNGGIGINGGLLMSLPTDMKYFRTETMGKTVIMGRKTLESFPGGKPLPKRRNIVLSTTLKQNAGYEVCRSVDELMDMLSEEEKKEAFVIGGGQIYKLLLPFVEEVYITEIDAELNADTFIPVFKNLAEWKCVSVSDAIEENGVKYAFAVYRRNE